ncbi:MAG: hypothetical protein EA353_05760 [Puniceicoccaceae bacterium]|nr:MAG: hypothetical protein EA353_05760 [Puniceicoccaceae bacterium]
MDPTAYATTAPPPTLMYFLGIDGGGSRTRACLCDETGSILGQGVGGPSNPCTQSPGDCLKHIRVAMQQAMASVPSKSIAAVHLGIAGAGNAAAHASLEAIAAELFDRKRTQVTISNDLRIAHMGGLLGQAGIALVAGTGSGCLGIDSAGRAVVTGGWGDYIDDAGSGSWIGLRALQVCVRQADGRSPGANLQQRVLDFLKLESMSQFKQQFRAAELAREERARLAREILSLAEAGDSPAIEIIDEAIHELTGLLQANQQALGLAEIRILLMGGLNDLAYFREKLQASIEAQLPGALVVRPRLNPTAGALLIGMRSMGIQLNEPLIKALETASKKS